MICVIDNYDSFTFNLVQILAKNQFPYIVFKNDEIDLNELLKMRDDITAFLISPGPGRPEHAGISLKVVEHFYQTHKIFGVCLGHQVLAKFFGAQVVQARHILHGRTSLIEHSGPLYKGLNNPFLATRYHSLIVEKLPECLIKTSWTRSEDGCEEIMGFCHKSLPLEGVQFHPESILCEGGEALITRFFQS